MRYLLSKILPQSLCFHVKTISLFLLFKSALASFKLWNSVWVKGKSGLVNDTTSRFLSCAKSKIRLKEISLSRFNFLTDFCHSISAQVLHTREASLTLEIVLKEWCLSLHSTSTFCLEIPWLFLTINRSHLSFSSLDV